MLRRDFTVNTFQKTGIINWAERKMRIIWVRWIERAYIIRISVGHCHLCSQHIHTACLQCMRNIETVPLSCLYGRPWMHRKYILTHTGIRSHMKDHTTNSAVVLMRLLRKVKWKMLRPDEGGGILKNGSSKYTHIKLAVKKFNIFLFLKNVTFSITYLY